MKAVLPALAVLAAAVPPAPAAGQAADSIVLRAAAAYRQLHALSADFEQVVENPMVGTFTSRGTLAQAGSSRLAMRFSDPPGEAVVIDGTYLWLYAPSTAPGQVLRSPIAQASGYGVNLLGWLLDDAGARYRSEFVGTDQVGGAAVDVIRLTPRTSGLPFTAATVWLGRSDALPHKLQVVDPTGSHRTITLSNLRPNPTIPAGTFTFTPPAGVKVVDR